MYPSTLQLRTRLFLGSLRHCRVNRVNGSDRESRSSSRLALLRRLSMLSVRRLLLLVVVAALLSTEAEAGKKKKKVKKKKKGKTSVSFGDAEAKGFGLGESDEEFLQRLTGSDAPQMQRIVTGVDPRKKQESADDAPKELTPEQIAAKEKKELGQRTTELWKLGTIAKDMGLRWKSAGTPSTLFPEGDDERREKLSETLAKTANIKIVDYKGGG